MKMDPCVFCGSLPRDLQIQRIHDSMGFGIAVHCLFCNATGPIARVGPRGGRSGIATAAVEMWNDRSGKAASAG